MDAMYSAIKGRRGGLLNDHEENAHQMPEEQGAPKGGGDMQGLVESLSPEQKSQLLALLVQEQAPEGEAKPNDAAAIQKGEMGPGEMAELDAEAGEGHESEEEIMESMISSADKSRVDQGAKPRNLGERVKMSLASKLKKKG